MGRDDEKGGRARSSSDCEDRPSMAQSLIMQKNPESDSVESGLIQSDSKHSTRRSKSRAFESLPRHSKKNSSHSNGSSGGAIAPPSPQYSRSDSVHREASQDEHRRSGSSGAIMGPEPLGARVRLWANSKEARVDMDACKRWVLWLRGLIRDRLERAMMRKQYSAQRELCQGRGMIILRVFRKLDPAFQRTLLHYTEPTIAREPIVSPEFIEFCARNASSLSLIRRMVYESEELSVSFQFAYYRVEIHSEIGYLASNQTFDRPILNVWLESPL